MNNVEVNMTDIKKLISEKITITNEIIENSTVNDEFKEVAFSKVLDYLLNGPSQKKELNLDNKDLAKFKSTEGDPKSQIISKTLAGFLRKTNAESHFQKVVTIAYYLMNNNKMIFTKEDIEKEYQNALMPKSKNTNAEINSLIQKGLVMSTGDKIEGKKSFKITMDGINYVEEELIKND